MPAAIAVVIVLGGACSSPPGVVATDAWSPPVPTGSPAGAVFMEISNGLDSPVTLTGATSDDCGAVELHETTIDEAGVTVMQPMFGGLTLTPGQSWSLAAGGEHLMCLEPAPAGDTMRLTLTIRGAEDIQVEAVIEDR